MEDLEQLVTRYQRLKEEEKEATAARRAVAEQIATALEHPDEGSKTHKVGEFKVTIKGVVNRKVDWPLFDNVRMPRGVPQPVIEKRELDLKGIKWIRENHPDVYARLATAITATPGAVQVEVRDV